MGRELHHGPVRQDSHSSRFPVHPFLFRVPPSALVSNASSVIASECVPVLQCVCVSVCLGVSPHGRRVLFEVASWVVGGDGKPASPSVLVTFF